MLSCALRKAVFDPERPPDRWRASMTTVCSCLQGVPAAPRLSCNCSAPVDRPPLLSFVVQLVALQSHLLKISEPCCPLLLKFHVWIHLIKQLWENGRKAKSLPCCSGSTVHIAQCLLLLVGDVVAIRKQKLRPDAAVASCVQTLFSLLRVCWCMFDKRSNSRGLKLLTKLFAIDNRPPHYLTETEI